jgi:hypothetical protein
MFTFQPAEPQCFAYLAEDRTGLTWWVSSGDASAVNPIPGAWFKARSWTGEWTTLRSFDPISTQLLCGSLLPHRTCDDKWMHDATGESGGDEDGCLADDCDVDRNGWVDSDDLMVVVGQFGAVAADGGFLLGDTNADGVVDIFDIVNIVGEWGWVPC